MEAMSRMRRMAAIVSLKAGDYYSALHHSSLLLQSMNSDSSENEIKKAVVLYVRALICLKCPEEIKGVMKFCEKEYSLVFDWLHAAISAASNRHEEAVYRMHSYLLGEDANELVGVVVVGIFEGHAE